MHDVLKVIAREPAMVVGLVVAVLVLLVTFGVPIKADQSTAIKGVVEAVLVLLGALYTRSQVTPTP